MVRRSDKKKVKVEITYSWEFSEAEWWSFKYFQRDIQDNIKNKVEYDHISAFHLLNNMCWADLKDIRVKKSSEE